MEIHRYILTLFFLFLKIHTKDVHIVATGNMQMRAMMMHGAHRIYSRYKYWSLLGRRDCGRLRRSAEVPQQPDGVVHV